MSRGSKSPIYALLGCQISLTKHKFKDKILKNFKMATSKHYPQLWGPLEYRALCNCTGCRHMKLALTVGICLLCFLWEGQSLNEWLVLNNCGGPGACIAHSNFALVLIFRLLNILLLLTFISHCLIYVLKGCNIIKSFKSFVK